MRSPGTLCVALLCLCATARAAQPAAVSLSLPSGRLALTTVTDPHAPWSRSDDGRLTRDEGRGAFDGGAEIRDADGVLEIRARRKAAAVGEVAELRLVQSRECSLRLTVRPPDAGPAPTLFFREADLTRLVLRHPGARPYLDALLADLDPSCHWRPDAFAVAQLGATAYVPPTGVAARVAAALAGLADPDWRARRNAAAAVADPDAALFVVLRVDRAALTPEQRRGLDAALSTYPVLTRADREALSRVAGPADDREAISNAAEP